MSLLTVEIIAFGEPYKIKMGTDERYEKLVDRVMAARGRHISDYNLSDYRLVTSGKTQLPIQLTPEKTVQEKGKPYFPLYLDLKPGENG